MNDRHAPRADRASAGSIRCAALGIVWLALTPQAPAPVAAQIQVEGRAVETWADGPCVGLLTTGSQRYVDCGNGTVYDTRTRLLWLRDVACDDLGTAGVDIWIEALRDVADLEDGLCDLTDDSQAGDWRLPTEAEWVATVEDAVDLDCISGGTGGEPSLTDDAGTGCYGLGASSSFVGPLSQRYWSATSYAPDPGDAHAVDLDFGTTGPADKTGVVLGPLGIWPVRDGGGPGPPGTVVVEGAVARTKRSSDCLAGLSDGAQRQVDCGDGTVLDLHTGLVWLADASCPDLLGTDASGQADWPTAMAAAQALSHGTCGLTDGSQPGEWRLPTRDEWLDTIERALVEGCTSGGAQVPPSITDETGQFCWALGKSPFDGIESASYWASDLVSDSLAGVALLGSGLVVGGGKSQGGHVWPVRSRR